MSEKTLYAVKNDEGEWMSLDGTQTEIWYSNNPTLFKDKSYAEAQSMGRKAHVVELVEPKKVVLTKEQAEIVEGAHNDDSPAFYIFSKSDDDEELLMDAYVNGYTVAKEKEKKYNVKVPYAEGWHFQKYSSESKRGSRNDWKPFPAKDIDSNMSKDLFLFTEAEIEHYGLQDCEKEEVTDDAD